MLAALSLWLGRSWVEVALLAGSVVTMIVELLNTGIETATDRIGLSGMTCPAKDMGSAAVLPAA